METKRFDILDCRIEMKEPISDAALEIELREMKVIVDELPPESFQFENRYLRFYFPNSLSIIPPRGLYIKPEPA